MGQLGFYYDMTRCIGCKVCQIACKDRNNLEPDQNYRIARSYETGTYPNVMQFHYAHACNHCESPACVAVCPTGAMQKAPDGTVVHDDDLCIGCSACVMGCPYGVPILKEGEHIAGKCDSCYALRQAGKNPACVDACIMRAIEFGDLDELRAKHGGDLVNEMPFLPAASETNPSLLIKSKRNIDKSTVCRELMY